MKFLSLNIRGFGVGKDSKHGWLKSICRVEKPNFVVLQETKLHTVDLQPVHVLWGNQNYNFIPKEMVGKSGGQLIIWDTTAFDVTNSFISDFSIGIQGVWKSFGMEFNVVNVYGPHEDQNKHKFWDQLQNKILINTTKAWVVCGVSMSCLSVVSLDRDNLDHCPIILKDDDRNFGPKPLEVYDEWINIDGVDQVIKEVWDEDVGGGTRKDCRLRYKLKITQIALRSKSSQKFGDSEGKIELFKFVANILEIIVEKGLISEERKQWLKARKEWVQREKIKVSMLRQKVRVRWIFEGDGNTRGLTINGIWCENPLDNKEAAYNHFKSRFEDHTVSRPSLMDLSYPNLSIDEANSLEAPISEVEIVEAIHDCGSSKAPGPDEFNLRFFKNFWDIIKVDVINAITWFWENGEILKGCNASFVTLIPKKNYPITLSDYCLTSLIGGFYKIAATVLSNRLRKVIPRLVGSE
ncbi:uncharacterized protein [Rutidosis leptorrhynchoides]|uniref:uncharacterized protein n=1 Tax=Rutidosis leptorrhynchoides TaxID=125765 RepID=UPI003A99FFFC